jgi:hypothetical protein
MAIKNSWLDNCNIAIVNPYYNLKHWTESISELAYVADIWPKYLAMHYNTGHGYWCIALSCMLIVLYFNHITHMQ